MKEIERRNCTSEDRLGKNMKENRLAENTVRDMDDRNEKREKMKEK